MGIFKNKINIAVLIFFIASLVCVIFMLIFDNSRSNNENKKIYDTEQISIYSTDEYLVKEYDTFYQLEQIAQGIISALSEGKASEVYKVLSSDVAEDISKEQYIELLNEFYISNFSDVKDENGNVTFYYKNSRNLLYAYKIDESNYILEIKNNHDTTTKVAINTFNSVEYKIVYLEF